MSDKSKALDTAILQLEKKYGSGTIMRLGDNNALNVEAISTGSITLDCATGIGGFPRGRIIEVYGPESSGKTTLALHVVAEAQKLGGEAAFVDAEHALDPVYAKNLGVDVDSLFGPDQQAPVGGRKQAVDPRVAQRLRIVREMLVMADRLAVVTVETVLGAEPHVSGAVLRNGVDIVAAQPVHHGERLHVQRPALVAAAGRSGGRQRQEQKRYPFSRHRISTVYFIQTGAA